MFRAWLLDLNIFYISFNLLQNNEIMRTVLLIFLGFPRHLTQFMSQKSPLLFTIRFVYVLLT